MAVTRATGKAYRLSYAWVMAMAGYETTPAEDMPQFEPKHVMFDKNNPDHRRAMKEVFPLTDEEVDMLANEMHNMPKTRAVLEEKFAVMKSAIGG